MQLREVMLNIYFHYKKEIHLIFFIDLFYYSGDVKATELIIAEIIKKLPEIIAYNKWDGNDKTNLKKALSPKTQDGLSPLHLAAQDGNVESEKTIW